MQQTSIDAYHSLGAEKITERQQQILIVLEEHYPACNRELSLWSSLPINSVTPRVLELRKKGLVEMAHQDMDVTGKRVIYWRPVKQEAPKSMRRVRRANLEEVGSDE
jgi:hypothetical protein